MQLAEIETLQKRLTDDGCYAGPIDGQASDAVKNCPDQDPVLRIETGMHTAVTGASESTPIAGGSLLDQTTRPSAYGLCPKGA